MRCAVKLGKRCESNTRICKSRKMRIMLAVTVFVAAYSTRACAGGVKSAASTHLFKQAVAPPSATTRIHIGSCSDTHEPQPLWSVLEKRNADAFFWGGDVVRAPRPRPLRDVAATASVGYQAVVRRSTATATRPCSRSGRRGTATRRSFLRRPSQPPRTRRSWTRSIVPKPRTRPTGATRLRSNW